MEVENPIRVGATEVLVAAIQALTAIVLPCRPSGLQHRAHRAIEEEDSGSEGIVQLISASAVHLGIRPVLIL